MVKYDFVEMHGPHHHILTGAALITDLHNAGMAFDLGEALEEMIKRGRVIPGGICGNWGICGGAASIGTALSIVYKTSPLSENEYYKNNLECTSRILERIAQIGGPRCCKRNCLLALSEASVFLKEKYDIELEVPAVFCEFSKKNLQCIEERCPFFSKGNGTIKKRVAFICVHNSCRSQIAEALGKKYLSEICECYSAGTETKPQINQDAVRLVKEMHGIDMEKEQYSKLLDEIPKADIVISMGCNVVCPSVPGTIRYDWGLDDPTGQDDRTFIEVINRIEVKILELGKIIKDIL